jgi:hypothetical protein
MMNAHLPPSTAALHAHRHSHDRCVRHRLASEASLPLLLLLLIALQSWQDDPVHVALRQEGRYLGYCHVEYMLSYAGFPRLARQIAEERDEQFGLARATCALARAATEYQ